MCSRVLRSIVGRTGVSRWLGGEEILPRTPSLRKIPSSIILYMFAPSPQFEATPYSI